MITTHRKKRDLLINPRSVNPNPIIRLNSFHFKNLTGSPQNFFRRKRYAILRGELGRLPPTRSTGNNGQHNLRCNERGLLGQIETRLGCCLRYFVLRDSGKLAPVQSFMA